MPLYEFRCKTCRQVHEAILSFSQSSEPNACPHCGGSAERIYSATTVKVFQPYANPYGKGRSEIRSESQERAALKANGRVLTSETKAWDKIKRHAKRASKKPIYFSSSGSSRNAKNRRSLID